MIKLLGCHMNRLLAFGAVTFGLFACETNVPEQEYEVVDRSEPSEITFRLGDEELMHKFATVLESNEIPHRVNADGTISYYRRDRERVQVVLDEAFFEDLRSRGIEPGDVAP